MIEIRKPTKEILIEIIEGLLLKKYNREEVVEWQNNICKELSYYGPGVVMVPLKNEEGRWYFISLAILLETNKLSNTKDYFIRDKDLRNWLNALKTVKYESEDSQIKILNIDNNKDWKELFYLLHFNDSKNVLNNLDKVFNFERGFFDDLGDLKEVAIFEYKNFRFALEKSYDHFLGLVNLSGEENIPAIVVAQLLEYLGIEPENLIGFSKKLSKYSYKLLRMDDNGITYVISDNLNYVVAYLHQKRFELGTHKQTYWIE